MILNSNEFSFVDTHKSDDSNIESDNPDVSKEIPTINPVKNAPRKVQKKILSKNLKSGN